MKAIDENSLGRLEAQLGRLLFAGVMSAATCLGVGLAIWMIGGHAVPANRILTAGLVILMITPIARVITSLVVYVRMRDWLFVATTIMVLAVLLLAWVLKT